MTTMTTMTRVNDLNACVLVLSRHTCPDYIIKTDVVVAFLFSANQFPSQKMPTRPRSHRLPNGPLIQSRCLTHHGPGYCTFERWYTRAQQNCPFPCVRTGVETW
jgi:hypothetical protein